MFRQLNSPGRVSLVLVLSNKNPAATPLWSDVGHVIILKSVTCGWIYVTTTPFGGMTFMTLSALPKLLGPQGKWG